MEQDNEKAGAVGPMVSWLSKLFVKLADHLDDVSSWRIVGIVDTPKGSKQPSDTNHFDHEYVVQHAGSCEDDWYGHIYLPIGEKYLDIEFNS